VTALIESADNLSDELIRGLAGRFETTAAEVRGLARRIMQRDQSLHAPIAPSDAGSAATWLDLLASDEPTPEDRLVIESERRLLADLVAFGLARLPAREQFIIRNRYLSEAKRTLASIGRELNLSKDRVRQLEARALTSLREIVGARLAELR
jgi:RNA polymerase sigma-32 factor